MNDSHHRYRNFSRRTLLLGLSQGALLTTVISKMYSLQILEAPKYRLLSEKNRIRLRFLIPERGLIYDCHKNIIAEDQPCHRACLVRQDSPSLELTLTNYCIQMRFSANEYENLYAEIVNYPSHLPFVLYENLTWEQVSLLELNRSEIPGIYVEKAHRRAYALGPAGAHLIGYAGLADKGTKHQLVKVGKAGIEKILDERLAGVPGQVEMEVDARNQLMRVLNQKSSVKGESIALSICAPLQQFMYERLVPQLSASAVVMKVDTGDILALCSVPSFDPQQLSQSFTKAYWQTIVEDPFSPMTNKAISGQYPPGSIFKTIVALAALEGNFITESVKISCPGYYMLNNHPFHCWKKEGHGLVNLNEAIRGSCDVYFYEIARMTGIQRIGEMARLFGLGDVTSSIFPHEKKGFVPTREWKWLRKRETWRIAETIISGIGQGYFLSTPIQLAQMTARLATGFQVNPCLIHPSSTPSFLPLKINPAHLKLIKKSMNDVCNHPQGTNYAQRIPDESMAMAGKTATSQVKRITLKDRELGLAAESKHEWHVREHGLFVGYAPVHQPQFAVSVVCEHGGRGSQSAGPIGRDILWHTQKLWKSL